MANRTKNSDSNNRNPFRLNDIRKSYDKVPQPKGEFKNLFQAMREKSKANTQRSAENDKSNR